MTIQHLIIIHLACLSLISVIMIWREEGARHAIILSLFPCFILFASLIINTYESIIDWWKYGDFVAKLKLIYRVQLKGYGNDCLMHENVYEKMIRQNRRALKKYWYLNPLLKDTYRKLERRTKTYPEHLQQ